MAKDLRSTTPVEKFSYRKEAQRKKKKKKKAEPDQDMTDMGITIRENLDGEDTAHILDSEEQAKERKRRFKVPM